MQDINIFPWSDCFDIGIDVIDNQHRQLVLILNRLNRNIAFEFDNNELNTIFDELIDYAVYHFKTEEEIWDKYLPDKSLSVEHQAVHQRFVDTVSRFKLEQKSRFMDELTEEMLEFLVRWLTSHILETDRYMAYVVLALQDGLSFEDAKNHAQKQMGGSTSLLINSILSTYGFLASNTLHLIQEISKSKQYDVLTGLPNRSLFSDRLHQAMAQTGRRNTSLAVVYLDIDCFKMINDLYGRENGDKLLGIVASRMKQTLRESDTIARFGGDEFAMILLDLNECEDCISMLTRLLFAASEAVIVDGIEMQVSASMGVAFFENEDQLDADQLLRQADQAMYQAKLSGKNRYYIFDAAQDLTIRTHHESLEEIENGLLNDEFILYYQPKVNMYSGEVIGVEALIRWNHPEKGILSPTLFLPIIEGDLLLNKMGELVLNLALNQIQKWRSEGLMIPVSVNVDAIQLQQKDFMEQLHKLLLAYPGVKQGDLELEVLETSALEDISRVSRIMRECHKIGVDFLLDDFGTGYSSLTYLKQLPVRQLKIDQSFVKGMLSDPNDLAIIDGVLGLASAFRLDVIAEGVESIAHGEMLLRLGCQKAQGFAIVSPMPPEELIDWIAKWRPSPKWLNRLPVSRSDMPLLYAEVEHIAWVNKVISYLRDECLELPNLNPHKCHFGEWLDETGIESYGSNLTYKRMEKLHLEIHEKVSLFIKQKQCGAVENIGEFIYELKQLSEHLVNVLQELEGDFCRLRSEASVRSEVD